MSLTLELLLLMVLTISNASIKQISPDKNWQQYSAFGQLSAVTTDSKGNVFIFHRGDHKWDAYSFDINERFTKAAMGPIKQATIVVLSSNGSLLSTSGTDFFYLPHGITVDFEGNIWTTDVALHQVMKFPPLDLSIKKAPMPLATLTLGEALVPGHDDKHFCKPTSVAVDAQTGDFYVADGYCNSRIIKYSRKGHRILQWGKPSPFRVKIGPYSLNLPHSLTIDEKHHHLFVADRENARVLCYNMTDGNFMHQLQFGNNVYAVTFSNIDDNLLIVTGLKNGVGTAINVKSWTAQIEFRPENWFDGAHDLAVSPDGRFAYVVELTENIVWRFTIGEGHPDRKKVISETSASAVSEKALDISPKTTQEAISSASSKADIVDSLPNEESSDFKDDALAYLDANQVAISFVTAVVLFAFVAIIYHVKRRGGSSSQEMQGLMYGQDD